MGSKRLPALAPRGTIFSTSFAVRDIPQTSKVIRFGAFEVDLQASELRKHGLKIKLQDQPFVILTMLLERPGQLVTREELRLKLWPADTFVDFDHGLNNAINRLREALGDSADLPRFIETLPRRGYRFIASPEGAVGVPGAEVAGAQIVAATKPEPTIRRSRIASLVLPVAALIVLLVVLMGLNVGGWRDRLLTRVNPPHIESLAVLPLENVSGDPAQDYLADGMTDALTTDLAQIKKLRVISRTSAMRYKKANKPLPEIARELSVDAVVEGTVMRSGNRVRVSARLIHASTDRHLWAASYERDLGDVLALQADVARAIATEIRVELSPQEQTRLANAPPVNPEAYEAYLQGRYYMTKRTPGAYTQAIEYFQQAIQKDPRYAPAYAALADLYSLQGFSVAATEPAKEAAEKAKAAVRKALELDDASAETHAALGRILHVYDWDWTGAEKEFLRALDLNPGYATAYHWYSLFLHDLGRMDEARAMIRRARQLDPVNPNVRRVVGEYLAEAGQSDRAIEELQAAIELDPSHFNTRLTLGFVYLRMGQHQDAIAVFRKADELSGGLPRTRAALGYAYATSGKRAEAEQILQELEAVPAGRRIPYLIAPVCVALGRKDEAFRWLEQAYRERRIDISAVGYGWEFDSLRSDPRFQDLLRRMRLPPHEPRK